MENNTSKDDNVSGQSAAAPSAATGTDGEDSAATPGSDQGKTATVSPASGEEQSEAASTRRAHLTLSRVEPWSVMKFSFVISLVCFIVLFVAVVVIYSILSALGVFDAVSELVNSLSDSDEGEDIGLEPGAWFSAPRVLGYTGLVGALNIILITALSTVGAMLYNLAADLVGGLDITLSESE